MGELNNSSNESLVNILRSKFTANVKTLIDFLYILFVQ